MSDMSALLLAVGRARRRRMQPVIGAELGQELVKLEYPRLPVGGQILGFQDGDRDVREFRATCLDGHVPLAGLLLLRWAMSGAGVQTNPAGNSNLRKRGGPACRDDVACAIIMAVAEDRSRALQTESEPFSYAVL